MKRPPFIGNTPIFFITTEFRKDGSKDVWILWEWVHKVNVGIGPPNRPVLIIWGERDRVLPLKHAYLEKNKLPNAKLVIAQKCGHLPIFERADEFNRIVLDYL